MGIRAPLLTYFGIPKQTDCLISTLKNNKVKIQLTGLVGSSFAITASSVARESINPHLFVFKDKESASYFVNDIENLLKNDVFFFPASYRRAYQIEETENSNILLRGEVLNKLNDKKNPIIVTYSEALSEKVVSRKKLKQYTITLKKNDNIVIEELEGMLQQLKFEQVDFVIQAGQYSIRGGIIDVYSYANEHPYRLELFNEEIESIRTFDINSQLSIVNKNKIVIVPNTEAKKSIDSQVSFLDYLPKKTIIWISDINYTKEVLSNYFHRASEEYQKLNNSKIQHLKPEHLFTNGIDFIQDITSLSVIETSNQSFFTADKSIEVNTTHLTRINKQFDLLKEDLKKNQEEGLDNIILCSSD